MLAGDVEQAFRIRGGRGRVVAVGPDMSGQERGAGGFAADDFLGRYVVVPLVVEGMGDGHADQRGERQHDQRPHVPDQGEAQHAAEPGQHDAGPGVAGHVDGHEALLRAGVAALLHLPPGVQVVARAA